MAADSKKGEDTVMDETFMLFLNDLVVLAYLFFFGSTDYFLFDLRQWQFSRFPVGGCIVSNYYFDIE